MKKLLYIATALLMIGCKKTEIPTQNLKTINYTCFSEIGVINLSYIDKERNVIDTTIFAKNYNFTSTQLETNFDFATKLKSFQADSIYIKAELDGKKVEDSFRSKCCNTTISVQLINLK
jgi:hypothetical protein